jgi:hypothetical protein
MKRQVSLTLRSLIIALLLLATVIVPVGAGRTAAYTTGFTHWRAADGGFAAWGLTGVTRTSGALQFVLGGAQSGTDPSGGYYGHNFYNGGSFFVGEATGPVVTTPFNFTQAIASWNAGTPTGTWIETLIRARLGSRWTKWYNLGVWAADYSTVERHSVKLQGDADGNVAVDTLIVTNKKSLANAYQVKVRLFSSDGVATPVVRNVSVAVSTNPPDRATLTPGDPSKWNYVLAVPECSQMVYEGGNAWCSPTSTSMVLGYWGIDPGPCEPRVRAAVAGVYDWLYGGHGNWPFNTAYAASRGMEAYVARYTSLAQLEPWINANVPVVMSIAWGAGELTGAPISSSNGHLIVLVGFDAQGNPVVNDPAAATDSDVQRTYLRNQLEKVWLENSGGTVYLIYPPDQTVPDLETR